MKLTASYFILSTLLLVVLGASYNNLKIQSDLHSELDDDQKREMLFFPNGSALKAISFGYENFLANILWFKTVSYFGKHYKQDQNFEWLSHMCNVTIELDPEAVHIPEFCSLMLAWEAKRPDQALKVLDKAISQKPYWRYYYLRGINNLLFFRDSQAAKNDFQAGANLEETHLLMTRLAAKTMANLEDPETALNFMRALIVRSKDPNEKQSLEKHLKRMKHEVKANKIYQIVIKSIQETNREPDSPEDLENLIQGRFSLKDEYGGTFFWDSTTKKIQSTSGVPTNKIVSEKFSEGLNNEQP